MYLQKFTFGSCIIIRKRITFFLKFTLHTFIYIQEKSYNRKNLSKPVICLTTLQVTRHYLALPDPIWMQSIQYRIRTKHPPTHPSALILHYDTHYKTCPNYVSTTLTRFIKTGHWNYFHWQKIGFCVKTVRRFEQKITSE